MQDNNKICFIISPIGQEGSEIRRRADQVLKHIISPAIENFNFKPVRADKISEPGLITSQTIQHIIDSPLVIADLTGSNANVFYEIAIRHAIRKPLIQIIQKGEKIPFDVAGMRAIPIDHRDLDSVDDAKIEIAKQIKSVLNKKPEEIESPISIFTQLQKLREGSTEEGKHLAQLVQDVSGISNKLIDLDRKIFKQLVNSDFLGVKSSNIRFTTIAGLDRIIDYASHDIELAKSSRDKTKLLNEMITELVTLRSKINAEQD